jgi:hypothetical protein
MIAVRVPGRTEIDTLFNNARRCSTVRLPPARSGTVGGAGQVSWSR